MALSFGSDSPLSHENLPGSTVNLGWYNVTRKRLQKLAGQYIAETPAAVTTLKSQGQTDTSDPEVIASRQGFNELRVRLPVLNQYYTYTGLHGGVADASYLAKVKEIVLAWVQQNQPTGKPIDETNFENLLRVIKQRWGDFSGAEQTDITNWVTALKDAKEGWSFEQLPGEGTLQYGNHYTHHYKILLQAYDILGLTSSYNATLTALDTFKSQNFPYGNSSILVPDDMPRAAVDAGESIDYIRRDALHYHVYDVEPWLEIALIEGGTRYESVVDQAFQFLETMVFSPPTKHYEFANTTDSFDGLRWEASNPEYLQPNAMFRPDKACRVIFSYLRYKQSLVPTATVDDRWLSVAFRSDILPSHWYYFFRFVFGGLYG